MVYRVYTEKKQELANEASALAKDIKSMLGIQNLEKIRIINRYDVENTDKDTFEYAKTTVFSEPPTDIVSETIDFDGACVIASEYLPGQFDQRADSAAQCIQIISGGERPIVRTAKIYLIYGSLDNNQIEKIKKYIINPVESRQASLDKPDTLKAAYEIPEKVAVIENFTTLDRSGLSDFIGQYGLAMDINDIEMCRDYFKSENRQPTITEIRVLDTYWSDHCRHTTFNTTVDSVKFNDKAIQDAYGEYLETRKELERTKPVNFMDIATIAAKYLKKTGKLKNLDESDEINACTVKIQVEIDGKSEPWLLLFKNETHNHPTEIEPFGGAATCVGGAIRDPLSGRSYVYAAMRLTGAADPLKSAEQTLKGKLPQKKIVATAAAGYSSYGNQIGLTTGIVDEIYHDGYVAKHMEIGAVIGAAPAENVRRECPQDGDVVILLGGKTGRDGCGGATGSSKSHNVSSLEVCGAEVQKGNAPEERKIQRLFRNKQACQMIKRCNDFGAGGVSVAIGELADGLKIDLNAVPKKYEGLDGTELAISESQERMAVVVSRDDSDKFIKLAQKENLEATKVADVTENPRLVMYWNGNKIVDISREFLNLNGAEKHIDVEVCKAQNFDRKISSDFCGEFKKLAGDLNVCSKRGLSERFDSTIGAGTVLMPFGGGKQLTPIQAMVHKISTEKGHTDDCSLMSWGYNPFISEKSPYHGAYLAVVESVSKLIAAGADFSDIYLTFQEYFASLKKDPKRWGYPMSALLGAFKAQKDLSVAAIGGKDSMSGSFEDLDVPPTLVSFAVTCNKAKNIISPEFKQAGHKVYLVSPEYGETNLPDPQSLTETYKTVCQLLRNGKAVSAYTLGYGGAAEAILKMCIGNGLGFDFDSSVELNEIFKYNYGAFILEAAQQIDCGRCIGAVTEKNSINYNNESLKLSELSDIYENKLESVYSCNIENSGKTIENFSYSAQTTAAPKIKSAKPKILIPVFPGTNCEYDSAKAVTDAGAEAQIEVLNNLTSDGLAESAERFAKAIKEAQMIFIPGGFSGGDEPDGSGKFITAFFRNPLIKAEITSLLEKRDGLMCGICNGFQALIKLGLLPYGKITETDENSPTLTLNTIGRHQSKIVRIRIASNKSPWLAATEVGQVYSVPISHGEGRFLADEQLVRSLAENGQIATQYVDFNGNATYDIKFNPNDSMFAVEGITSPDGRVFGKMGHSERIGNGLYKNVPGNYDIKMFESAVKYFK